MSEEEDEAESAEETKARRAANAEGIALANEFGKLLFDYLAHADKPTYTEDAYLLRALLAHLTVNTFTAFARAVKEAEPVLDLLDDLQAKLSDERVKTAIRTAAARGLSDDTTRH
jgi:CRISPR/Cas system CSM-associated protein Csm2 small subunit